jgi:hypothetical protein
MNRTASLCIAFVVALASPLFAQINLKSGAFGGLGFFKEAAKETSDSVAPDFKTGLTVGALLEISVLDFLSLEPGLAYSMRGGEREIPRTSGSIREYYTFTYLAVPLHAKVRMPALLVYPFFVAGPNFGLLLSAKSRTDEGARVESDMKNLLATTDIGIDIGGGVEMDLLNVAPSIECTYYLGLANIKKNATGDATAKNRGVEIKAGMKFKM